MENYLIPAMPHPAMSSDDLASVSYHIRSALTVLGRANRLSSGEIRAKTVLTVLMREVEAKAELVEQGASFSGN